MEQPWGSSNAERETFRDIFASVGHEHSFINILDLSRDLPVGILNVAYGNKVFGTANGVSVFFYVWHRPKFAYQVIINDRTVVNAKLGRSIGFSEDRNRESPCARSLLNIAVEYHLGNTLVFYLFACGFVR